MCPPSSPLPPTSPELTVMKSMAAPDGLMFPKHISLLPGDGAAFTSTPLRDMSSSKRKPLTNTVQSSTLFPLEFAEKRQKSSGQAQMARLSALWTQHKSRTPLVPWSLYKAIAPKLLCYASSLLLILILVLILEKGSRRDSVPE